MYISSRIKHYRNGFWSRLLPASDCDLASWWPTGAQWPAPTSHPYGFSWSISESVGCSATKIALNSAQDILAPKKVRGRIKLPPALLNRVSVKQTSTLRSAIVLAACTGGTSTPCPLNRGRAELLAAQDHTKQTNNLLTLNRRPPCCHRRAGGQEGHRRVLGLQFLQVKKTSVREQLNSLIALVQPIAASA